MLTLGSSSWGLPLIIWRFCVSCGGCALTRSVKLCAMECAVGRSKDLMSTMPIAESVQCKIVGAARVAKSQSRSRCVQATEFQAKLQVPIGPPLDVDLRGPIGQERVLRDVLIEGDAACMCRDGCERFVGGSRTPGAGCLKCLANLGLRGESVHDLQAQYVTPSKFVLKRLAKMHRAVRSQFTTDVRRPAQVAKPWLSLRAIRMAPSDHVTLRLCPDTSMLREQI